MRTYTHSDRSFIEQVIRDCKICFVSMTDVDGTPYTIPMNFGFSGNSFYLHSAQEGRSISILNKNPKVCITLCSGHDLIFQHPDVACSYSMRSKSVMAWGNVSFIDDFESKVTPIRPLNTGAQPSKTSRYGKSILKRFLAKNLVFHTKNNCTHPTFNLHTVIYTT